MPKKVILHSKKAFDIQKSRYSWEQKAKDSKVLKVKAKVTLQKIKYKKDKITKLFLMTRVIRGTTLFCMNAAKSSTLQCGETTGEDGIERMQPLFAGPTHPWSNFPL